MSKITKIYTKIQACHQQYAKSLLLLICSEMCVYQILRDRLAVDIALWNINKGMVIPSPMGNYLIMANTGWRTNAESNNRGNILNLIARGKGASVNYFWANKKWFYFRFNTHHCRKKKPILNYMIWEIFI